ncbi:MAG: DUF1911 domain-containing protein [Xenophilus sp.]
MLFRLESAEEYQKRLGEYEGEPEFVPFNFEYEIADYERCMQLIGLCYLLHRRDLLPRIAKLQDPAYAGEDTLYEELLVRAMYAETPEEASAKLAEYCQAWYPAMKDTPWHGGHERMTEDGGDYFGDWAFEAGAVALLYGIDDRRIDHMVYPRDLLAFARAFQPAPAANPRLARISGGRS